MYIVKNNGSFNIFISATYAKKMHLYMYSGCIKSCHKKKYMNLMPDLNPRPKIEVVKKNIDLRLFSLFIL